MQFHNNFPSCKDLHLLEENKQKNWRYSLEEVFSSGVIVPKERNRVRDHPDIGTATVEIWLAPLAILIRNVKYLVRNGISH